MARVLDGGSPEPGAAAEAIASRRKKKTNSGYRGRTGKSWHPAHLVRILFVRLVFGLYIIVVR